MNTTNLKYQLKKANIAINHYSELKELQHILRSRLGSFKRSVNAMSGYQIA